MCSNSWISVQGDLAELGSASSKSMLWWSNCSLTYIHPIHIWWGSDEGLVKSSTSTSDEWICMVVYDLRLSYWCYLNKYLKSNLQPRPLHTLIDTVWGIGGEMLVMVMKTCQWVDLQERITWPLVPETI